LHFFLRQHLKLLLTQLHLLEKCLYGDVQAREAQDVVDSILDEFLQLLHCFLLVAFFDRAIAHAADFTLDAVQSFLHFLNSAILVDL